MKHLRESEERAEDYATVSALVARRAPDVAHKVMTQELVPVVREAIDANVVAAINELVGLTPKAVAKLEAQLDSPDPVMSQRAAALIVKYTIGHPALVKPPQDKPAGLTVNIGLPRPEHEAVVDGDAEDAPAELRTCEVCGTEKPVDEFESGSFQCSECFNFWREKTLHDLESR